MTWEHVSLAFDASRTTATVTLNRPEALNAFFGTMREDLLAAIDEAASLARVLVVTGAGKAFSSGGDVRVMAKLMEDRDVDTFRELVEQGKRVVTRLRVLPIPSIAAVNGVAAGAGLGLALACDLRVAASSARFAASFTRIGLHPDWGASYFLTQLVGPSAARDLVLTGRMLDAAEAERIGLVDETCPDGDLIGRVEARAQALARGAPFSIRAARETLRLAERAPLSQVLDAELEAQLSCFLTEDAREGVTAFSEKRTPVFKGE